MCLNPLNACDRDILTNIWFQGTWFSVGLGACGKTNKDSDKIIAVSSSIYGNGKYCDDVSTFPCTVR